MKKERFQPCPYCQKTEYIRLYLNRVPFEWKVGCVLCTCEAAGCFTRNDIHGYGNSVETAIAQWNERAFFANTHEAREVLEKQERDRANDAAAYEIAIQPKKEKSYGE